MRAQLFHEPFGQTYAPQRGFVIATMPRSASTTLVKALNAHPSIECHREALHTQKVYANFAKEEGWTVGRRDANRARFLARLFQGFAGFKFFPRHLSRHEFDALARSNVSKIVLERQDVLAQYVSLLRGRATRRWRRRDTKDQAVAVDINGFRAFVVLHRAWYALLRAAAEQTPHWLFVSTENLTTDTATLDSIFAHLGVSVVGPSIAYDPYRANTTQLVANFPALRRAGQSDAIIADYLAASPLFSALRRHWKSTKRRQAP